MDIQIKSDSIELVDIDLLIENPDNTNQHPKEQIERLAKIIQHSGFRNPLTVSKRSGFVIAGHGRIEAARSLKMNKLPVIYQDFENEAEEYAHLNADNEIAKWATTDLAMVNLKMLDFGPDFDIDLMGIKDFVIEPAEKFEPQADEDAVPEVVNPITRLGDIWLLGNHRVMCGDSTMIDDVEKLMAGEKADMVFTDPPYNLAGNMEMANASVSKGSEMLNNAEWDKGFVITEALANIYSVLSNEYYIYVFTSHFLAAEIWEWLSGFCHYTGTGIYHRTNATPMAAIRLKNMLVATDLCCYGHSKKAEIHHDKGKVFTNVWSHGKTGHTEFVGHPTQKPISLCENVISHTKGERVLDLFLGSGSTLIACEKTNRKCYGMELDEKYCDVIIKRYEDYTGNKATLESTGQTYEELKGERDASA